MQRRVPHELNEARNVLLERSFGGCAGTLEPPTANLALRHGDVWHGQVYPSGQTVVTQRHASSRGRRARQQRVDGGSRLIEVNDEEERALRASRAQADLQ